MSPCLKIFIASLLEGADSELIHDALFLADQPLAMNAGVAPSSSQASDENHN